MDKDKIYRIAVMSAVNLILISAVNYIIENATEIFNGGDFAEITTAWIHKIFSLNYLGLWSVISVGFAYWRNRDR